MLRLMGLPHVARFPKAAVTRREDRFQILVRRRAQPAHGAVPACSATGSLENVSKAAWSLVAGSVVSSTTRAGGW